MRIFGISHSRTAYYNPQSKHPVWKALREKLRALGYDLRRSRSIPAGVIQPHSKSSSIPCDHFREYFCQKRSSTPRFAHVTDCHKLLDSIAHGTVPVYCGTPAIPPSCYIDRSRFASDQELETYLDAMTEEHYNRIVDAGRAFLRAHFVNTTCAQIIRSLELCEQEHRAPHREVS